MPQSGHCGLGHMLKSDCDFSSLLSVLIDIDGQVKRLQVQYSKDYCDAFDSLVSCLPICVSNQNINDLTGLQKVLLLYSINLENE